MTKSQLEVIDFLKAQITGLRHVVETHISYVFIADDRAFKLKRAVALPYVDQSTAKARLELCEREVALNRRTAPALYLGVRRIVSDSNGKLAFNGPGALVDAIVEMVRFDEELLLDNMAVRGELTPPVLTELARGIARFHAEADVSSDRRSGTENIAAVLDINEAAIAMSGALPPAEQRSFNEGFRESLRDHSARLDRRSVAGKVRLCHGDLHLGNICLFEGRPTLFDCLEFNQSMATVDILYDLAFLLMDLWHRGLRREANLVFNRYFDEADESDGLPVLPFFMAIRAAVRGHVSATASLSAEPEQRDARGREARAYFDLARELLIARPAQLVALGGLSGSGKSTIAAAIAPTLGPAPGARILSSDRIRKRIHGVPAETALPPDAYRPEVSSKVYELQRRSAGFVVSLGHAVVVDSVFDRPADRAAITEKAGEARFTGVWLDASGEVQRERIEKRSGDPSDATAMVLEQQQLRLTEPVEWPAVNAGQDVAAVVAEVLELAMESSE